MGRRRVACEWRGGPLPPALRTASAWVRAMAGAMIPVRRNSARSCHGEGRGQTDACVRSASAAACASQRRRRQPPVPLLAVQREVRCCCFRTRNAVRMGSTAGKADADGGSSDVAPLDPSACRAAAAAAGLPVPPSSCTSASPTAMFSPASDAPCSPGVEAAPAPTPAAAEVAAQGGGARAPSRASCGGEIKGRHPRSLQLAEAGTFIPRRLLKPRQHRHLRRGIAVRQQAPPQRSAAPPGPPVRPSPDPRGYPLRTASLLQQNQLRLLLRPPPAIGDERRSETGAGNLSRAST